MADSPLNMLSNAEITGKKPENLVGLNEEDIQKYRDAQLGFIKSLEDRYQQPNLFKVAAGFAKPQLGGFVASLGSAMDEYGNQMEKQRDIQLPLYKAKSELAAYELALKQKGKAAKNIETAKGENRTLNPSESMETTALEEGPSKGSAAGQSAESSQANQMMSALARGQDYASLVNDLGQSFVDSKLTSFLKAHPNIIPPAGMPAAKLPAPAGGADGTSAAPPPAAVDTTLPAPVKTTPAAQTTIPGVPASITGGLTNKQGIESTNAQIQQRLERVKELNTSLGTQAQLAAPIFESATTLYQAASKPSLAKAFATFERGGILGFLGKATEDQQYSSVLSGMRDQILHQRFGSNEEKDRALSDLQAFQNALGTFNTALISSFPNPTDARTAIESMAVPNAKNTQDSFLRGIARFGSDALSKHEVKSAYDKYLQSPNADVNNWENSDHYKKTLENAQKRSSELVNNPASQSLPLFMKNGLKGAYYYEPDTSEKKGDTSGKKSETARTNERVIGGKTYIRQPDNSWKVKE